MRNKSIFPRKILRNSGKSSPIRVEHFLQKADFGYLAGLEYLLKKKKQKQKQKQKPE